MDMKQYGPNKATEFSKKSLSPLYRAAKAGDLKVEKWFVSELYNLADYYGYDYNGLVADEERDVKKILERVFANDWAKAQELINSATEYWFSRFSPKAQKSFDRSFI